MKSMCIGAVTMDCLDPKALSDFYAVLLGWQKSPPVWPEKQGEQQQMVHIDFKVQDKEEMMTMVQHALECGARKTEMQYSDMWTVLIDPAGHPFCIDAL